MRNIEWEKVQGKGYIVRKKWREIDRVFKGKPSINQIYLPGKYYKNSKKEGDRQKNTRHFPGGKYKLTEVFEEDNTSSLCRLYSSVIYLLLDNLSNYTYTAPVGLSSIYLNLRLSVKVFINKMNKIDCPTHFSDVLLDNCLYQSLWVLTILFYQNNFSQNRL